MSRVFSGDIANTLTASISISSNRSAYTLVAWVKPDSAFTGSEQIVAGINNAYGTPSIGLRTADLNPCNFIGRSADPAEDGTASALGFDDSITKNNWHFIAVRNDGTTLKGQANLADYTSGGTGESITTALSELRIGANAFNVPYGGKVAHVAAWTRALSDEELDSLAGGSSPNSIDSASRWFYYPLTDSSLANSFTPAGSDTAGALSVNGTVTNDDADNPSVSGGGGGDTLVVVGNPQRNRRTSGRRM